MDAEEMVGGAWCRPKTVRKREQPQLKPSGLQQKEPAAIINPQATSIFFRTERGFPPEVRNLIFDFSLMSYEDQTRPREFADWGQSCSHWETLSGYHLTRARLFHIDTALLRTCRLMYQETCLVPAAINTHTWWIPSDLGRE